PRQKVASVGTAPSSLLNAATHYREQFPPQGWEDQDAALWDRALAPTIARALGEAGAAPAEVTALGVCGQLDGCVAVDADGRPLKPCLVWKARRGPGGDRG